MGVYNPLVDMPETCDSCFMYGKCELWLDCENSTERRHRDCPLVEVKTPHGRLIDADALKTEVYTMTEWNGDVHRVVYEAAVDNAPIVIKSEG